VREKFRPKNATLVHELLKFDISLFSSKYKNDVLSPSVFAILIRIVGVAQLRAPLSHEMVFMPAPTIHSE
jgi:hypothetical protein